MSVSIHLSRKQFFIAAEHKEAALAAAKPIYGHWVRKGDTDSCETLEELLEVWGYEAKNDGQGNITNISLTNEKLGEEKEMFKAIAPYVKAGSFLELSSEDGSWRWIFDGTTCVSKEPGW